MEKLAEIYPHLTYMEMCAFYKLLQEKKVLTCHSGKFIKISRVKDGKISNKQSWSCCPNSTIVEKQKPESTCLLTWKYITPPKDKYKRIMKMPVGVKKGKHFQKLDEHPQIYNRSPSSVCWFPINLHVSDYEFNYSSEETIDFDYVEEKLNIINNMDSWDIL